MDKLSEYYNTRINKELKTIYDIHKSKLNKHFIDNVTNIISKYSEYENRKYENRKYKNSSIEDYGTIIYTHDIDYCCVKLTYGKYKYRNYHFSYCCLLNYLSYDSVSKKRIANPGFSYRDLQKVE